MPDAPRLPGGRPAGRSGRRRAGRRPLSGDDTTRLGSRPGAPEPPPARHTLVFSG
ncbi:hypothetical protein NKH77_17820 [Streptomyces sp. M19]